MQCGEIMTRPEKTDLGNVILRGEQSFCGYLKVPKLSQMGFALSITFIMGLQGSAKRLQPGCMNAAGKLRQEW